MKEFDFDAHTEDFLNNGFKKYEDSQKIVRFIIKVVKDIKNKYIIKVWDVKRGRRIFKASNISKKRLKLRFEDTIKCYKRSCIRDCKVEILNKELVYGTSEA